MNDRLGQKSREFVERLNRLVRGCVADAPEFGIIEAGNDEQLRIGPLPFDPDGPGFSLIPLVRSCDDTDRPKLMLKIEFRVSLDDEFDYLAVQDSTY